MTKLLEKDDKFK
jgi:hypothetical protein